ncbi:MAG: site-specific DNA-methyltransferase [Labilibaculum sp.]|nr:site-specific DNA-methyltransferase [Labilibaculum sp.]MBI9060148.1 site-specific DNA-methyltransferase [Labilibaculum sp.]
MNKLKMETPNITDKNIEQIAKLFPNVITEIKDENGNIKKAVDFDLLKQNLSNVLVEDENERYRLDWPGKKASLLKANLPINKTLRPAIEESVDFEHTENLYIEGDNFEVLKILQESYLGKIKMIYIDPPYNTGNDFIYKDNFKISKDEYEEELGTENEEGEKLFKNTDSNGRFHSDWLSMMYERLTIARDLLKDDGVIFISIDDNEVHNLRKISDEIFGEENFVDQLIWKKRYGGGAKEKHLVSLHEYILMYCRNIERLGEIFIPLTEESIARYYKLKDVNFEKRGPYRTHPLEAGKAVDARPNLVFEIKAPDGTIIKPKRQWYWNKERVEIAVSKNEVEFVKGLNGEWTVHSKQYLKDENGTIREGKSFSIIDEVYSQHGTNETLEIFGNAKMFSYPKPTLLIKKFLQIGLEIKVNDIILDFFSGSATTAHAVMQLNAEDGGNRKFIMVQLPEKTDEKSEAYKAGYKTIAEIGKERIRRAGKKIIEELEAKNTQLELGEEPIDTSKLDIGFRVYKTDSSNMKDVFYHPTELKQEQLLLSESNIKEDRTPEDLLTQVILDLGLELSLKIEKQQILGNNIFIVQENALVACFDDSIDFGIVDKIADLKPFKVVFKDASFKDDKDRINVEERFKRLSPETVITVI